MKKMLKRYSFFIILVIINILILMFFPAVGQKSLEITWSNTLEMLSVIPPIFILLGLLDVWVQRETMITYVTIGFRQYKGNTLGLNFYISQLVFHTSFSTKQ